MHTNDAPLQPITHPLLSGVAGLRHGFFTREGGVSSGIYASLNCGPGSLDSDKNVRANRKRVAAHFGVTSKRLCTLFQCHSADVCVVDNVRIFDRLFRADGLVTRQKEVVLGVLTADCGPVLLADAKNGVIGALHAGWKGAFKGLVQTTVEAMVSLGANPADTVAVLGPTIAKDSYEVDESFKVNFLTKGEEFEQFFSPGDSASHYWFDLPGCIAYRLNEAGITNHAWIGEDTYENEARYYSYRRVQHNGQPDYGRLISCIMLEK